MTTNEDQLRRLDEALAQLPQQAEPERDLWPEIEAQLATPRPISKAWPLAVAAALVACIGLVIVNLVPGQAPAITTTDLRTTPPPATATTPLPAAMLRPTAELISFPGDGYGAVRQTQIDELAIQLMRLPEAERQVVAENLHTIRKAINDIDSALADNPDSALLRELLRSSYQQELTTINRVNRLAVSLRDDL